MRKVTCINNMGATAVFSQDAFNPWFLVDITGVYSIENNVYISENTMSDGGTYQGSTAKVKDISITVIDKAENVYNKENRDVLYSLFPKDTEGTLKFEEDGRVRVANYYVEYVRPVKYGTQMYTINLRMTDPFFYGEEAESKWMAAWTSKFVFVHYFKAEGEPIGEREALKIQNIVNETGADNIGLTITITAIGAVRNPSITRVESNESLTIGSAAKPLELVVGDSIVITTGDNNKHVYLYRENVAENINHYLTEDSEFFQIMRGNNNIGYSAEDGDDNMVVRLSYRMKYRAV
ncbi:MAG: phage tail family protein [Lachnospiraceae bacterium]|nr:phage tail family protein [Lachnospiraceae bacterium]